ncbi:hypothetical protein GOODEAATRI_022905 [Goodea atripinnis]|uniref:Uncharacterized protein n=1 Tax=Goodea atripinnis TaxID=208336 RepID=A0ABV0N3S9_9TELE
MQVNKAKTQVWWCSCQTSIISLSSLLLLSQVSPSQAVCHRGISFYSTERNIFYSCLLAPDRNRNIFVVMRKEAVCADAYNVKLLDRQTSNDKSVFCFLRDPNQNTQVTNVGMLVLWWVTDRASCIWFSL